MTLPYQMSEFDVSSHVFAGSLGNHIGDDSAIERVHSQPLQAFDSGKI